MGEQTTTVVPFAAGGPSALATSRYLPATARKKKSLFGRSKQV